MFFQQISDRLEALGGKSDRFRPRNLGLVEISGNASEQSGV
jgi:hypothetical protein